MSLVTWGIGVLFLTMGVFSLINTSEVKGNLFYILLGIALIFTDSKEDGKWIKNKNTI